MQFNVITLFPDTIDYFLKWGVIRRAFSDSKILVQTYNPRKYTKDIHQTVDDRPYGGGDGMVIMADVLALTLNEIKQSSVIGEVIYLSPQGEPWRDELASHWVQEKTVKTLICGRYGGIDNRVLKKYSIKEISIGDYILSGGELAALVVIDSVARKLPGVLGNEQSAANDSFSDNGRLEAPLFTRPVIWEGFKVPDVLLSGHHRNIQESRDVVSLLVTAIKRPDIVKHKGLQQKVEQAINLALNWEVEELMAWGLHPNEIHNLRGKNE